MKRKTQNWAFFILGILVSTASWAFYHLINMAFEDGLEKIGIQNPYIKSITIIVFVTVLLILAGWKLNKILNKLVR